MAQENKAFVVVEAESRLSSHNIFAKKHYRLLSRMAETCSASLVETALLGMKKSYYTIFAFSNYIH